MHDVDIRNSITSFVDSILKGGIVNDVDTVVVSIRMEDGISTEDDFIPDTFYHMLFYSRSNYVLAMGSGETDNMFVDREDTFEQMSYHDSAWRIDAFSDLYNILMDKTGCSISNVSMYKLKEAPMVHDIDGEYEFDRYEKTIEVRK